MPVHRSASRRPPQRMHKICLVVTWLTFLFVGMVLGAQFIVTTVDDEPYDGGSILAEILDGSGLSLREAIELTNNNGGSPIGGDNDGDDIKIDDSLFDPSPPVFLLDGELTITDDLKIDGSSDSFPGLAVFDGNYSNRHFRINAAGALGSREVVLENLSLCNGYSALGGGSIVLGDDDILTLNSVSIVRGQGQRGGAICNSGGTLTIRNSTLRWNLACGSPLGSGGAIFNGPNGNIFITDTLFDGNVAKLHGGAIEDQSNRATRIDLTLINVEFTLNEAGFLLSVGDGGAIHVTGSGSSNIIDCTASQNTAYSEGGAYYNDSGTMSISGGILNRNTAICSNPGDKGGGGIFNNGGTLTIVSTRLTGNSAEGPTGNGGGVLSTNGRVTMRSTTLSSNAASSFGGALSIESGELALRLAILGGDSALLGNTAQRGGGLYAGTGTDILVENGSVGFNSADGDGPLDGRRWHLLRRRGPPSFRYNYLGQ